MKLLSTFQNLLLAYAVVGCGGCASLVPQQNRKELASQQPPQTFTQRKQEAVLKFEQQRDAAQVQAAINCWERGEIQNSQAMLTAIVQRTPGNVNARLRLAEVLTAQHESSAAEAQLRECLALQPASAEALHALGLLLSNWPGREQEAHGYLQRASELEPDNVAFIAE